MHAFELIVLFIAALATGGLMVNWAGLARAMAQLSPSTYVELHQSTNRTFDPYQIYPSVFFSKGSISFASGPVRYAGDTQECRSCFGTAGSSTA